jgi:hypothetical protein
MDFYKRACKKEKFKPKTVNRFSKIKETFTVKPKMISVDHYFHPHDTLKNVENIF